MSDDDPSSRRCENAACTIDWLVDPQGPNDPEWRARARDEAQNDPRYLRWKERNAS